MDNPQDSSIPPDIHSLVTPAHDQPSHPSPASWASLARPAITSQQQVADLPNRFRLALLATSATPFNHSRPRNSLRPQIDNASHSTTRRPAQTVEKPCDDPSVPVSRDSQPSAPKDPRAALTEYLGPRTLKASAYSGVRSSLRNTRPMTSDTTPFYQHMYHRGLLEGKHSDIEVIVFGHSYALHRIVLVRSPYFASAFSEPWSEAKQKTIHLHPEQMDKNITPRSWELALKRLYGCADPGEEVSEARALLATGSWLQMDDLVQSSADSMIRTMEVHTIAPIIDFLLRNYYGKIGERVLSSAKARLCRDGWSMPIECWDGIPTGTIREVIGGDAFYIESEYERIRLVATILSRRLRGLCADKAIPEPQDFLYLPGPRNIAPRPTLSEINEMFQNLDHDNVTVEFNHSLYVIPEIKQLLILLDQGIHYCHMTFEQIQAIRAARDFYGFPLLPDAITHKALWSSMELRQHVINASETQDSLGLTMTPKASSPSDDADLERKFWIPIADCNIYVGEDGEHVLTTSGGSVKNPAGAEHLHNKNARKWFADFLNERASRSAGDGGDLRPIHCSKFPPFRFGVEFPNVKNLPSGKRVYSRTVSYAGSLWNVYIQRVKSSSSSRNGQLGIYLHRARDRDLVVDSRYYARQPAQGVVVSQISQLERQLGGIRDEDSSDEELLQVHRYSSDDDLYTVRPLESPPRGSPRESSAGTSSRSVRRSSGARLPDPTHIIRPVDLATNKVMKQDQATSQDKHPVLPDYVDLRPSIKTYFKIYTSTKGSRMLSVGESSPDNFKISQSWGWKSSGLPMVDDGTANEHIHSFEDFNRQDQRANEGLQCVVVLGVV